MIVTVAGGVAKLVLGSRWEDTGLPKFIAMTPERLAMSVDQFAGFEGH